MEELMKERELEEQKILKVQQTSTQALHDSSTLRAMVLNNLSEVRLQMEVLVGRDMDRDDYREEK